MHRPRRVRGAGPRTSIEGAGFEVWRPFPGGIDAHIADPFFLLDQLGPVEYAPNEAVGAPWHPHRGFETVTYVIDGVIEHHDSNGGGGIIGEGDTQWMTAGAGHPPRRGADRGVPAIGWPVARRAAVGEPARRAEVHAAALPGDHARDQLKLLTSEDGGALVRLIAGDLAGHAGPGSTHTPITYAHASVSPGAQLERAVEPDVQRARVRAVRSRVRRRRSGRPVDEHQLVVFGPGDTVTIGAAPTQPEDSPNLEVLLLGGLPIREPIAHYGPFLMNTREEILQAIEDFQAGRMGVIPAIDGRPGTTA